MHGKASLFQSRWSVRGVNLPFDINRGSLLDWRFGPVCSGQASLKQVTQDGNLGTGIHGVHTVCAIVYFSDSDAPSFLSCNKWNPNCWPIQPNMFKNQNSSQGEIEKVTWVIRSYTKAQGSSSCKKNHSSTHARTHAHTLERLSFWWWQCNVRDIVSPSSPTSWDLGPRHYLFITRS